jgi:hypothetical protein
MNHTQQLNFPFQTKKTKVMQNHYEYWYKRIIKDGLKSCKLVIGLGLSVTLGYSVNIPIGILFFGWVFTDSLINKN